MCIAAIAGSFQIPDFLNAHVFKGFLYLLLADSGVIGVDEQAYWSHVLAKDLKPYPTFPRAWKANVSLHIPD